MSLLVRLKHTAYKMAFLLAVNEGTPRSSGKHIEVALRFMEHYLQKCYGYFSTAAKSTDTKDIKGKILEFCHAYYDRHHEWPARYALGKERFWRNSSEQTTSFAFDNLVANEQISEIREISGSGVTKIVIATVRPEWRSFALLHGQRWIRTRSMPVLDTSVEDDARRLLCAVLMHFDRNRSWPFGEEINQMSSYKTGGRQGGRRAVPPGPKAG